MALAGEGGYMPRHMFPGPAMTRFRGMAPPVDFSQGRGMMSPPAMSPTSPSQRGQRPQFPPYHNPDMMHPGMPPRSMGPRPMLPPDVMSKSPNADSHMGMMPPHMQGYSHPPPHSQAMMNRPPYNIHPPHSSGAVDFPPWPHHPNMSMANFRGHRMPAGGPQSAPHSPSSTSPLRMQNVGPGFPKDPHMMSPEPHLMNQGDPCMASNLRMFAEQQQRLGMMRQRHPMMPHGSGAAAFPPHQRLPQPRHPMFPEEGVDPFHPLHAHPASTPSSNLPDAAHMAISQAMSPLGQGAPRPPFPEAVSLAPTSSLAPMMSSVGAPISSAPMEPGMKGLGIAVNQPGMPGCVVTKIEPGTESPDMVHRAGEGVSQDMDLEQRAKHNALLKQLLSKEQAAAFRGEAHPPSTPDSEESLPQLTPEQQRQLELIDMMPLCKETEASADLPDWDNKTLEEKEQILGTEPIAVELRKQEYEKKRKQYEAVRKKRKNQSPAGGAEGGVVGPGVPVPKVKKRRTKTATIPPIDPNSLGTAVDLSVAEPVTKKRGRRNKNRESRLEQRESELEFMAETFLQQLHSLPSVPLREPDIRLVYSIVPIKGAPNVTGVSALRGKLGQAYLDTDFDVYRSLCFPPPPPCLQPSTSSTMSTAGVMREKEMKHSPEIVTCVATVTPAVSTPVVSSPTVPVPVPILPPESGPFALPAHPRIEVKMEPLSELVLRDTPDTIISSSSPECGFAEKESEFSSLRPIDPASPTAGVTDDKYSPTVPLVHPIPLYPKMEKQMEVKSSVAALPSTSSARPVSLPDLPVSRQMVTAEPPQAVVPAVSKPQDVGTQVEANQDLTVKLPTITSGLAQPFIDPTLDQKVSVTLTLSANASEDIGGVISAIADLLKIAVPPTYEITRSPSPEMFKMNMSHKEDVINIQALMRTKPTFCGFCHVVLINSGIRKHKMDLPPELVPEDLDAGEEEVTWCSMNCMNQFLQTGPHIEELEEELDEDSSNTSTLIMDGDNKSDDKMDVDSDLTKPSLSLMTSVSIPITEALSISTSSPALSASASATTQPGTPTTPTAGMSTFSSPSASPAHSLTSPGLRTGPLGSPHHPMLSPPLRGKEERAGKRHRRSSSTTSQEGYVVKSTTKRWRDDRWKRWDVSMSLTKLPDMSIKELNDLWESLNMALHPASLPDDQRVCALCHHVGDGEPDGPSRLLNYDVDKWIHLNCALWSLEVYETCNGALMNVEVAFSRGMTTECVVCRQMGATLGCFRNRCTNNYHLPCARTKGCIFFQDKTIICANHNNTPKPYPDAELLTLEVRRRVYINRDEDRQVASMVCSLIHQDEGRHALRIGSLILHCIGQLLPHQIQTNKFNTREFIYPVGFRTTRFYWSHRTLYKRCRYLCSIADNQGAPEFIVCVKEEGYDDVTFRDSSAKAVWMNMLQPLKEMHSTADMVKMFPEFMCMEELFGLNEPSIIRVLESLPGADLLHNYNFKYGRSPLIEMPPAINPTGCARTEPKLRTHFKRPHTLHSSQSRSLPSTVTSVTGDINSPYMKQFVHSKSQQYRRLKTEWKNLVYLGRSRIQGLGLYAARDLEKHTMVIEYIGDLIRNEVANRREKEYDDQNRGVYMFRIDNDTVIDATMAGGPARYINHSCSPNCVAEVVHFEKESKIIIITSRRIQKGEELTYDYKFDFEDDQHKIPCLCGATFCRKWMN